jgi:hypothetical protein
MSQSDKGGSLLEAATLKKDTDGPAQLRKALNKPARPLSLTSYVVECGQPGCHLDLDIDRARFDAFERNCCDSLDHACPCFAHEL